MPCYTVRTVSVELKIADLTVLERGLAAAGFAVRRTGDVVRATRGGVTAVIQGGQVTVTEGNEAVIPLIKQAYSAEAVRTAAKRFGWDVTPNRTNPQQMRLKRRFS